ncbi:MAG: imidazolonepropionase [Chloroflexi bacterium]|nr:imidazolonepropionase [Chloroflexota bacterium]
MPDSTLFTADTIFTSGGDGRFRRGESLKKAVMFSPGGLLVKDGYIVEAGDPETISAENPGVKTEDFPGQSIVPGLVDPHTHPIFGGSRLEEMILKTRGATYLEIQSSGGGIAFTTMASRESDDEMLLRSAEKVLSRMVRNGVTSLEAKSGYGLSLHEELRQLRLLNRLKSETFLDMAVTCLGAHLVPPEYRDRRSEFLDMITGELLPAAAEEKLADYADVFCDEGAFTIEESRKVLSAAKKLGMKLKIHAEEFAHTGGAVMAAQMGASSADHLLRITDEDIDKFVITGAVAVLLPLTALFLGGKEFPPARKLIDKGAVVALGSDYNAGSCFSESLPAAMSLGSLVMKMEPEEVIHAATINAAYSCGLDDRTGSLEPGKQADFLVLETGDPREWPYHPGTNLVSKVFKKGHPVWSQEDPEIFNL